MQEYSLCFIFNEDLDLVLLIQKNRPEWQKGFFNGIGGKFEKNETITECTLREIDEECGLKIIDYGNPLLYVGYYESSNWKVHITTIKITKNNFISFEQKTDEKLHICCVDDVLSDNNILKSAKIAIAASIQKHNDPTMGEIIVKYYK